MAEKLTATGKYAKFKGFKWLLGDEDVPALGLLVDDYSKILHICEPADADSDWALAACSHPTVCIHSATDPITDYIKMYHDGTDAFIDAVGATALNLMVGGTAEVELTSSALSPGVTNSSALGTTSLMWSDLFLASGGVINFNANEITMTHSTIGTGGKIKVETEWATGGATGRPFESYLTIADATRLGGYANAMKAMVDCEESGGVGAGTVGLLSAMNNEMGMPNGTCWGNYTCVEMEYVDQSSTSFGRPGAGSGAMFMYMAATGTVTNFDSDGMLWSLNGLTAAAGALLSVNSQTLRTDLDQGTLRYLVLSQAEDVCQLAITAVAASGTKRCIYGKYTSYSSMTSGNLVGVRGEVTIAANLTASTAVFLYGVQGKLICGSYTLQAKAGHACAVLGQLDVAGSTITSGKVSAIAADIYGANSGTYAYINGFYLEAVGGGVINSYFRAYGKSTYVFDLVSNNHLLYNMNTSGAASTAAGWLKIRVDENVRYINLWSTAP